MSSQTNTPPAETQPPPNREWGLQRMIHSQTLLPASCVRQAGRQANRRPLVMMINNGDCGGSWQTPPAQQQSRCMNQHCCITSLVACRAPLPSAIHVVRVELLVYCTRLVAVSIGRLCKQQQWAALITLPLQQLLPGRVGGHRCCSAAKQGRKHLKHKKQQQQQRISTGSSTNSQQWHGALLAH